MARVKLVLPEKFIYSTNIDVRITDINYGGHLGNDSVLSLIHEARVRFLAANNFTEKDIDCVGIIMTDTIIVYSAEGFYADKIRIDVAIDDITNTGFDIFYRLVNDVNEKEIAKAKTGIVFYNYQLKKVARTPKTFKDKFQKD
jgi:acyl-CoA thioesterase FadM